MKSLNIIIKIILSYILIAYLSSCAPALVGAGGVTAGVVGLQERTVGETVDDTVIWSKIKNLYIQKNINKLLSKVSVEVNQGRVLLTGDVKDADTRVEAVRLAWQVSGVKKVINEIQISDKTKNSGSEIIKTNAKDTWITTQIKSKMLLNKDIQSVNYSVDTVNSVVYLMGIAKSSGELKLVTHIASTVSGVKRVVSHVKVIDNK